jgi:NTP pyrophosphatase (non-canonical NTP hydrolase)
MERDSNSSEQGVDSPYPAGSSGPVAAGMGVKVVDSRGPLDMAALGLDKVRKKAREFAEERDWGQFHTPHNLLLALVGEVGELSEIFQWKGEVHHGCPELSTQEFEHLGEELADVLVYLVRLADVLSSGRDSSGRLQLTVEWGLQLTLLKRTEASEYQAPRDELFALVAEVGSLSEMFQTKPPRCLRPEGCVLPRSCIPGMSNRYSEDEILRENLRETIFERQRFPNTDIQSRCIIVGLQDVAVRLARLAKCCGVDLAAAVEDKMQKNAQKYPAALCRGSSAKYTAYAD